MIKAKEADIRAALRTRSRIKSKSFDIAGGALVLERKKAPGLLQALLSEKYSEGRYRLLASLRRTVRPVKASTVPNKTIEAGSGPGSNPLTLATPESITPSVPGM